MRISHNMMAINNNRMLGINEKKHFSIFEYSRRKSWLESKFINYDVLYDKTDVNKMLFYRLDDGEYSELLYNANTRKLIADDSDMDRFVKIRQVRVLEDDKYNV